MQAAVGGLHGLLSTLRKEPWPSNELPGSGMVPVEATALHVTGAGGPGLAVVYLNGVYADQSRHSGSVPGGVSGFAARCRVSTASCSRRPFSSFTSARRCASSASTVSFEVFPPLSAG